MGEEVLQVSSHDAVRERLGAVQQAHIVHDRERIARGVSNTLRDLIEKAHHGRRKKAKKPKKPK